MAKAGDKVPNARHGPRRGVVVLLMIWIAFIFGSSCTVIRPAEFFALVARFTSASQQSMERFSTFWGICWFTVVKGWHFTEFAILTLLSHRVIRLQTGKNNASSVLAAMLFCTAFAASDEWHQSFVADRFGTLQDVLIDCLGVLAAGGIVLVRLKRNSTPANNEHPTHGHHDEKTP